MPGPLLFIGAAVQMMGGAIGASSARKRAAGARNLAGQYGNQIANLEASRIGITDPYAEIQDLSSMIQNPFANLQVATGAAEIQGQQADLSLASMQETLKATGAGAGGATALAQAALRSKQGVAATIEKQEAENSRLRAQGESQTQQLLMGEKARIQNARAQGKAFMFQQQDQRDMQQLNRLSALQSQHLGAQANFQTQELAGQQQMFGAVAGGLMGAAGPEGGGGNTTNTYNTYNSGTGTCLTSDMMVLIPGMPNKYIKDIKVGDIIQTRNSTTKVIETYSHIRESIYEVGDLKITDDHPIYIENEWVLPETINNSKLIKGDIEVYYIGTDPGHFDVYDGSKTWNVSGDYDKKNNENK
jgi:hypothetical protein